VPSGMTGNLILIPLLPLLAALIVGFFGKRYLRGNSHLPIIIAFALSFFLSMIVYTEVRSLGGEAATKPVIVELYRWIDLGTSETRLPPPTEGAVIVKEPQAARLSVWVTVRADPLTAMMLVMVTFISLLVAVFSRGYMKGDAGYPRYFAAVGLFVFCMTMLVLSNNFLLTFVFWEGVGLCSYLLIGHWFQKRSASAAARKAFLVNRIGDIGFILGVMAIWYWTGSLDYDVVFNNVAVIDIDWLNAICALLFMGAIGKSAQFPLHVWLPDAMEGPTPVSALIHAATMVTAGVYLVARCTPLFVQEPWMMLMVSAVGALTALIAAIAALTQYDLKRVMAYSTVSQLGYMFMALGAGGGVERVITFGVIAGMFHLFTHAFFKALLFLGSGSVMHAMGNVIDMRRFGGLRTVLPITHITFLIGAAALSGLPPFAGFFSKDEILVALSNASQRGGLAPFYAIVFGIALVTAFLTAFYTFRAYFLTFWGETRIPPEAEGHAHEGNWWMKGPLVILAVGALGVGWLFGPATHEFGLMLENTPNFPRFFPHDVYTHGEISASRVMTLSIILATAGVLFAALFYIIRPGLAKRTATVFWPLYYLSLNKLYFDELYQVFLVKPAEGIAAAFRWIDANIVDGLVDLTGRAAQQVGRIFQPVQNGLVQLYALASLLGVAVFAVALLSRLYR
jgi:NADH-quinone oxidoreductase subunit L